MHILLPLRQRSRIIVCAALGMSRHRTNFVERAARTSRRSKHRVLLATTQRPEQSATTRSLVSAGFRLALLPARIRRMPAVRGLQRRDALGWLAGYRARRHLPRGQRFRECVCVHWAPAPQRFDAGGYAELLTLSRHLAERGAYSRREPAR